MTAVSGTFVNPGGDLINGSLHFKLSRPGRLTAGGGGPKAVGPHDIKVFTLTNGVITGPGVGPYTVYGLDVLNPEGLYYIISVNNADGGLVWQIKTNAIVGASVDLGAISPIAPGGIVATLDGDCTGPTGNNTVEKIQNRSVATTAPSTGAPLKYDGTHWEPSTSISDLDDHIEVAVTRAVGDNQGVSGVYAELGITGTPTNSYASAIEASLVLADGATSQPSARGVTGTVGLISGTTLSVGAGVVGGPVSANLGATLDRSVLLAGLDTGNHGASGHADLLLGSVSPSLADAPTGEWSIYSKSQRASLFGDVAGQNILLDPDGAAVVRVLDTVSGYNGSILADTNYASMSVGVAAGSSASIIAAPTGITMELTNNATDARFQVDTGAATITLKDADLIVKDGVTTVFSVDESTAITSMAKGLVTASENAANVGLLATNQTQIDQECVNFAPYGVTMADENINTTNISSAVYLNDGGGAAAFNLHSLKLFDAHAWRAELFNNTGFTMTIKNNSGTATFAPILTKSGGDVTVTDKGYALLIYDTGAAAWRLMISN